MVVSGGGGGGQPRVGSCRPYEFLWNRKAISLAASNSPDVIISLAVRERAQV